ncbi:MAG: hypothetical protein IJ269_01010 [Bacteroidales bacterium]|nr:hypothetical protein [Bacteroidales bacterium]
MKWENLTDRQKNLDKSIERCGVKLDNTEVCLSNVMNAIGAKDDEAGFVRKRIEIRLRTAALLGNTDSFISNTERMLDQFEKDEEEWRKKLGF